MTPEQERFVKAVAKFCCKNESRKSVMLHIESLQQEANDPRPKLAKEWADVRSAAGLFGYMSVEDAEKKIQKLLNL